MFSLELHLGPLHWTLRIEDSAAREDAPDVDHVPAALVERADHHIPESRTDPLTDRHVGFTRAYGSRDADKPTHPLPNL